MINVSTKWEILTLTQQWRWSTKTLKISITMSVSYLLQCLKNIFLSLFEACSVSSLSHLWTEIPFLVLYCKWKQNPLLDKRKKNGLWHCLFWFTGCTGTLWITLSHLFNFPKDCISELAGDLSLAGIQFHFFTSSFHICYYTGGGSFAST